MLLPIRTTVLVAAICLAPCAASADVHTVDLAPWSSTDRGLVEVSRLEHSGRVEEAVELLDLMKENCVVCPPDHVPAGVADLMAARLYERAGRQDAAAGRYRQATASPLGDIASWRLGRLLSSMGDRVGARSAFGSVSTSSSWWVPARMALAAGLMEEARPDAAAAVLRGVMDNDLDEDAFCDARLGLAEAEWEGGDPVRAAAIAKVAWIRAPDKGRLRMAGDLLGRLGFPTDGVLENLRKLSRAGRRELKTLDTLARKRPTAFSVHDPALPLVVRARYGLASGADPGRIASLLGSALQSVADQDLKAYALYLLGEAFVEVGDDQAAARTWGRVVAEFPGSPFAASSGYSGARAWMRAGGHGEAVTLLKMVEDRVPGGSSLSLRWERALAAMIARDLPEALGALDQILDVVDHGDGLLFGTAERARYFRGVVLHDMGRDDEARVDLERVARSSEYSWFGILARSRLEGAFGMTFDAHQAVAGDAGKFDRAMPSKGVGPDLSRCGRLTVTDRSVGALFMLKMEDRAAAESELATRARRGLLQEPDLVLLAMLKAASPDSSKAMRAASWLRGEYDDAAAWVYPAAYPRPWGDAVQEAAARFDMDPALIYGVMRAESNFRASVRSPAGAYGLMQLMRPTARTIVRKVLAPAGLSASIQKPSGNVLIGAALLDRLIVHFDGYLPLVFASYNAGSGSGRRFLRTLGGLPTDLLVEAVPYAETRDYIKRVTGFVGAYRRLYGGSVPLRLALSAPMETGPWIDVRSARRFSPDVVANPAGECRDEPQSGQGSQPRK